MTDNARRIVIIQGHPDPAGGHFCHALAQAYEAGAAAARHALERINVAGMSFPPLRSQSDQWREPPSHIATVQAALRGANHVLMLYPLWNGTAPALLRSFLEQVFRPAFIFPGARSGERLNFSSYFSQRKALAGKTARILATMQMPGNIYRWFFRPHTEVNTLRMAGFKPVRETLIGNVEAADGRGRERWLRAVGELGRAAH
jgi:putative NADPH-quinone reductase